MTAAGFHWGVGFWLALLAVAFAVLCVIALLAGVIEVARIVIYFANSKALDIVMAPRLKRWRADPRCNDTYRFGKPIRGWRNRSYPWDRNEFHAYIREHD